LIQSQNASAFGFSDAGLVTDVAGVTGPAGLSEHAAGTDPTHTNMTKRIVRDIMGSICLEPHRYHMQFDRSDIVGGAIIHGGTR
jgi:hypothetical protein